MKVPEVDCEQAHAGLAVSDIMAAVEFYTTKLGFKLGFTWGEPPTFAGVNLGQVQMFLQRGTPDPKGCSVYFVVGDADALYEFHRASNSRGAGRAAARPYSKISALFPSSVSHSLRSPARPFANSMSMVESAPLPPSASAARVSWTRRRVSRFMVVSRSCIGFISP